MSLACYKSWLRRNILYKESRQGVTCGSAIRTPKAEPSPEIHVCLSRPNACETQIYKEYTTLFAASSAWESPKGVLILSPGELNLIPQ